MTDVQKIEILGKVPSLSLAMESLPAGRQGCPSEARGG